MKSYGKYKNIKNKMVIDCAHYLFYFITINEEIYVTMLYFINNLKLLS